MNPADLKLLSLLQQHNAALRVVLCTLARRGAALRRDEPERARAWIDTLSVHPYYKGGQFVFDLLEWEDFMLDGEPPPVLDEAALASALNQYAQMLRSLGAALGQPVVQPSAAPQVTEQTLPELNGSLYLFPDVVLGVISVDARWPLSTNTREAVLLGTVASLNHP
jgi:hypothetical protein